MMSELGDLYIDIRSLGNTGDFKSIDSVILNIANGKDEDVVMYIGALRYSLIYKDKLLGWNLARSIIKKRLDDKFGEAECKEILGSLIDY